MNFFDNAEAYAGGESERIMGEAISALGWERHSYVISTKVFWGIDGDMVNMSNTLNRKYLMHSIDGSLRRLGLDFVDLLFCHRSDPATPLEETVWAMSDIVSSGKALYWGTSEWSADDIRAAWEIAERHHLHKPVMEQPQYNLFERRKVERSYARLYDEIGLGLTTWSPLASGLLTGKYVDGVPEGSRGSLPGYEWLRDLLTDADRNDKVRALSAVAERLECSLSQLSIAWCASTPHVSTVLTGAIRVEQVHENLGALDVMARLTPDVLDELGSIVG
ncbi:MAG: aldo/keto reductase [Microthrixaceae bacterium]